MNIKLVILTFFLLAFTKLVIAKPSINEMQSCQALIEFIDSKLSPAPSQYPTSDVKNVRDGLKVYNQYIQREIITPGLLAFNGGNSDKANAMQQQVDAYKQTIVNSFKARYPQHKLFADQVVGLNNCTKKAVPAGNQLESLKIALHTMLKLAKLP